MIKKILYSAPFVFGLNWVWENFHSQLYLNYRGEAITEWILTRSALVDMLMISVIILIAFLFPKSIRGFVIVVFGVAVAVVLEHFALGSGRWAYSAGMPIIPFFRTGLTPIIQLAITGFISYRFFESVK